MSESNGTAVLEAPETEEAEQVQDQPEVTEVKQETPKEEPKPTSDWNEQLVNEIREAERAVATAELAVETAKDELKFKKAQFDVAVHHLREVIKRGPDPQPKLFTEPKDDLKATDPASERVTWRDYNLTDLQISDKAKEAIVKFHEDHPLLLSTGDWLDWIDEAEDFKISVYFSEAVVNEITDACAALNKSLKEVPADDDSWRSTPLESIGLTGSLLAALVEADFTTIGKLADHTATGRPLTDIKGIGPAKAETIEQALEGFWANRNAQ